ncbi:MAG TPA: N-succinylarginine dihydrolase [Bacteriovoracaceae bacterium]|nr:N-succinylarginine dihydrolase [Bacteriovoracaceae bacterium]
MKAVEVNFDGLVGPTHNYSGLSYGNVASTSNENSISRPKEAALQGLRKMKDLLDRGFVQGIIPPQERPNLALLRAWGFSGKTDADLIENTWKKSRIALAMATSSASMWTANAATVSPSADSADGKIHLTPANLSYNAHRAQESEGTQKILQRIFSNPDFFTVHSPVNGGDAFGDEGAANHTRLCDEYGQKGVQVFVYGREAFNPATPRPTKYPARQTLESSQVMARNHQLDEAMTFFVQQNPETIDQGVFHNDVISVGNRNVFFHHEEAFYKADEFWKALQERLPTLKRITVKSSEVPVKEAIKTYLFNTQLISSPKGGMILVAPTECKESPIVRPYIEKMIADSSNPINEVLYFDLRQSMRNGGGPACLRLRVVLNEMERQKVNQGCLLNEDNYKVLVSWVEKYYREELQPDDLRDPSLLKETCLALDELTKILNLGSIYPFQQ